MTTSTETTSTKEQITPRIEKGEEVKFEVGFNRDRLAKLTSDDLVPKDTWDHKEKSQRVQKLLELFGRLPEKMSFQPGVTAIFGENGDGKTVLADSILMALRMEQFRQKHGLSREVDILDKDKSNFYARIPGHIKSTPHHNPLKEDQHNKFIASLAECLDVGSMVLHNPDEEIGDAIRTPAALGNVAMGLSSRQAIDLLSSTGNRKKRTTSVRIFDEPELGMSPRRHMETLIPMLSDRVADGSIELVPSNSVILYESEVPRIDLDQPERGIFVPNKA